jgi:hypothetical protein
VGSIFAFKDMSGVDCAVKTEGQASTTQSDTQYLQVDETSVTGTILESEQGSP